MFNISHWTIKDAVIKSKNVLIVKLCIPFFMDYMDLIFIQCIYLSLKFYRYYGYTIEGFKSNNTELQGFWNELCLDQG